MLAALALFVLPAVLAGKKTADDVSSIVPVAVRVMQCHHIAQLLGKNLTLIVPQNCVETLHDSWNNRFRHTRVYVSTDLDEYDIPSQDLVLCGSARARKRGATLETCECSAPAKNSPLASAGVAQDRVRVITSYSLLPQGQTMAAWEYRCGEALPVRVNVSIDDWEALRRAESKLYDDKSLSPFHAPPFPLPFTNLALFERLPITYMDLGQLVINTPDYRPPVGIVLSSPWDGGEAVVRQARQALRSAKSLAAAGLTVDVWYAPGTQKLFDQEEFNRIESENGKVHLAALPKAVLKTVESTTKAGLKGFSPEQLGRFPLARYRNDVLRHALLSHRGGWVFPAQHFPTTLFDFPEPLITIPWWQDYPGQNVGDPAAPIYAPTSNSEYAKASLGLLATSSFLLGAYSSAGELAVQAAVERKDIALSYMMQPISGSCNVWAQRFSGSGGWPPKGIRPVQSLLKYATNHLTSQKFPDLRPQSVGSKVSGIPSSSPLHVLLQPPLARTGSPLFQFPSGEEYGAILKDGGLIFGPPAGCSLSPPGWDSPALGENPAPWEGNPSRVRLLVVAESCGELDDDRLDGAFVMIPASCGAVSERILSRFSGYRYWHRADGSYNLFSGFVLCGPLSTGQYRQPCIIPDEDYLPLMYTAISASSYLSLVDRWKAEGVDWEPRPWTPGEPDGLGILGTGSEGRILSSPDDTVRCLVFANRERTMAVKIPASDILHMERKFSEVRVGNPVTTRGRAVLRSEVAEAQQPEGVAYHFVWSNSRKVILQRGKPLAFMIERVLQTVCPEHGKVTFWYGDPLPAVTETWLRSLPIVRAHPECLEIRKLDLEEMGEYGEFLRSFAAEHSNDKYFYSHFTDIARALLLYVYGGWYLDTDIMVFHSYAGEDSVIPLDSSVVDWDFCSTPIYNPRPGAPFWKAVLDYQRAHPYDSNDWSILGPRAIEKVSKHYQGGSLVYFESPISFRHTDPTIATLRSSELETSPLLAPYRERESAFAHYYDLKKYEDPCASTNDSVVLRRVMEAALRKCICDTDAEAAWDSLLERRPVGRNRPRRGVFGRQT